MSEWWTYSPADFLMFSPRTYYRLFEIYNAAIWPVQLAALAAGIAILALLRGGPAWSSRTLAAMLAGAWLWVAWGFLLHHYDTINWAGRYMAAAFAVQALLLGAASLGLGRIRVRPTGSTAGRLGIAILLLGLFGYPMIGLVLGRRWQAAELFGLAPDPTVIATLGILMMAAGNAIWPLAVIPLVWCALTGATLGAMHAVEAVVAPLVAMAFLVARLRSGRAGA